MKMLIRKTVISLTMVFMLLAGGITNKVTVLAASGETIVYITKTGECYHKDGCSSLSHSKIEITLQNAVSNYRPCKRCKPPVLDGQ